MKHVHSWEAADKFSAPITDQTEEFIHRISAASGIVALAMGTLAVVAGVITLLG